MPVQVIPDGIQSVNGSDVEMGCTGPLGDSGTGPAACEYKSNLVDGVSPNINTSTSDWASQLVTVRRDERDPGILIPHVLLTFGFEKAVPLTEVEIDLFLCPDWNISAPYITVYVNEAYNLTFPSERYLPFVTQKPTQSSCDSLSTVTVSGEELSSSYHTVHILVDFLDDPPEDYSHIKWVFIGDVKFLTGIYLLIL